MAHEALHQNRLAGAVIVQHGKVLRAERPWLFPFGLVMIYSFIIPIVLTDFMLGIYQATYFATFNIPRIARKPFIIIDRGKLSQLNFFEKFNCRYCGYVNGVVAYAKAVAAQTEIYSCAIKHKVEPKGQDHQGNFYDYQLFE